MAEETIKDIFKKLEKKSDDKPKTEEPPVKKEEKTPQKTDDTSEKLDDAEKKEETKESPKEDEKEEVQPTDTEKKEEVKKEAPKEGESVSLGKTHPPEKLTKEEITEQPPVKETPKKSIKSFFATGKRENDEFDLSPARPNPKHIITIYGLKGAGKTSLGFSFPVTHGCLSFDNKSLPIAEQMDKGDEIVVFNGVRYLDMSSPDAYLESSNRSWRYLNKLLDTIHDGKVKDANGELIYDETKDTRPDWNVVDGGETFQKIAEMVMRYHNNLQPFQGITNKNIWKERRMYIDQLLRKCIDKSRKGVIWTTYIKKDEVVKQGELEVAEDIPMWIDCVMRETDTVIKVERSTSKTGQIFYATVQTSKWDKIPETGRVDITGKGVEALCKGEI